MNNIEFKPTKTWLRQHKRRPPECGDKDCYCILDHFNHMSYGFCCGILLNDKGDLDIVSFCNITYDFDNQEVPDERIRRYMWHPSEALWIATCLNLAVVNVFGLMPELRKQLGYQNRKRTMIIHKRDKVNGDNDRTPELKV